MKSKIVLYPGKFFVIYIFLFSISLDSFFNNFEFPCGYNVAYTASIGDNDPILVYIERCFGIVWRIRLRFIFINYYPNITSVALFEIMFNCFSPGGIIRSSNKFFNT